MTSACHHETAPPSTVETDAERCTTMVSDTSALVREDAGLGKRLDRQHATPVPHYQFATSGSERESAQESERNRLLERRPLRTALRI